jgi:hypothetical protein
MEKETRHIFISLFLIQGRGGLGLIPFVGVLGPTAHPGLPLKVFLGVGRCRQL